jgi:YwiC-like protein
VLTVAWFAAYPASYAGARLLHDRRPERFLRPFAGWAACAALPAAVLVLRFPWLIWVEAVLLALVAVNAHYARRNDERSLINDLAVVTECALIVPVAWGVSTGATIAPPSASLPVQVGVLTAVCWLVLAGSTLHVKSLIRERRDPRYARASRGVALASVGVSLALAARWGLPEGWWLVPPFVALAVRAFVVGRRPTRAAVIGLVELAMLVLVAFSAWLA